MSANDLIIFWDETIIKWTFSVHFEFCNIYLTQEMQNDWTMNMKQNVMSHTRVTHDKFHNKKIQNDCQLAIFFFFFLIFFSYLGNLAWMLIYEFLLSHTSHSHHIPLGDFLWHFDPHINNPLITRATNKEILVSAFQEKVSSRSSSYLANIHNNVSQWLD